MFKQAFRRTSGHWLPASAAMLALAGCGPKAASDPFADSGREAERIDCKVGDATAFSQVCAVERMQGADGLILTVHHPDGGFRRLKVTGDGRGVIAADGAEQAKVSVNGGRQIEVAVANDSYRLPATVKPGGAAAR